MSNYNNGIYIISHNSVLEVALLLSRDGRNGGEMEFMLNPTKKVPASTSNIKISFFKLLKNPDMLCKQVRRFKLSQHFLSELSSQLKSPRIQTEFSLEPKHIFTVSW